jgi:hypothetical protein
MKKQNWIYCRHCGKRYHTIFEANMCFQIDMEEIAKKESKKQPKKSTKK